MIGGRKMEKKLHIYTLSSSCGTGLFCKSDIRKGLGFHHVLCHTCQACVKSEGSLFPTTDANPATESFIIFLEESQFHQGKTSKSFVWASPDPKPMPISMLGYTVPTKQIVNLYFIYNIDNFFMFSLVSLSLWLPLSFIKLLMPLEVIL